MYHSLKESLTAWSLETTERQKLQHTYIAIAIGLLVVAGVFGLINQDLGQQILAVAIAAAAIFLVNAIIWALLQSFILFRIAIEDTLPIDEVKKPTRKRTTTKK